MGRTWRQPDVAQRTEHRSAPSRATETDEHVDRAHLETARARPQAPPETPVLDAAARDRAPDPAEERIREFVRAQESDPMSLYYVPPEQREPEAPAAPAPLVCHPIDGGRVCEGTAEILPDPMEERMAERARLARHDPLSLEYDGPIDAPAPQPAFEPGETRVMEPDFAVEGEGIHARFSGAESVHGDDRVGVCTADVRAGAFEEDGATRYGLAGRAEVLGGEVDRESLSVLGANVDAWVGEDGLALGAGATLLGATGGLEHDPTTADGAWKAGVSEGLGVGVRGHWGDTDGDGRREYGFGADIGMFSFDLSDEDPLATLASLIGLGPEGMVAPPAP